MTELILSYGEGPVFSLFLLCFPHIPYDNRIGVGQMLKTGRPIWFLFFFLLGTNIVFSAPTQRFLVVVRPVADLWSTPKEGKADYQHDDSRETQALYNEVLLYKGENANWYQVEATEQKEFSHDHSWQGYPGWIRKENASPVDNVPEYNSVINSAVAEVLSAPSSSSSLLFIVLGGTRFNKIGCAGDFCKVSLTNKGFGWIAKNKITDTGKAHSESALRENIVNTAMLFLKTPYLWGGRSFHMPSLKGIATGVDCSGLVNLAYRISGIDVARDAHEQWMLSKPIASGELKPGDLIFISKPGNFKSISHVMLSLGGEDFIEAPGTGQVVWISSFKAKFGLALNELKERDFIVSKKKIYFGKVL